MRLPKNFFHSEALINYTQFKVLMVKKQYTLNAICTLQIIYAGFFYSSCSKVNKIITENQHTKLHIYKHNTWSKKTQHHCSR